MLAIAVVFPNGFGIVPEWGKRGDGGNGNYFGQNSIVEVGNPSPDSNGNPFLLCHPEPVEGQSEKDCSG
jgi:hypothetical protein